MRITKVYTRGGDKGETSLVGGARVSKADTRVEAYGDIDELNSFLGLARARLDSMELRETLEIDEVLGMLQNDLFAVGSDLASPANVAVHRIDDRFIKRLEEAADGFLARLDPLKEFILPGGSAAGATLHVCRTIARRAERRVVALAAIEEINDSVVVYLNRLSDLLFILARVVNRKADVPEHLTDFSKHRT